MQLAVAAEFDTQLTPREMDVLRLLCSGIARNRDLAEQLVVSEFTAEYHVKRILAKLGVCSRVQVVAYAYHRGLVDQAALRRSALNHA